MNTPTERTENETREDLDALERELGLVGMIRHLQQGNTGSGDYTAERSAWLDQISLEELAAIAEKRRQKGTEAQR